MTRTAGFLMYIAVLLFTALPHYAQSKGKENKEFVLVIDAGHGGKDPGAIGRKGTRESNVNLSVAKQLGSLIESKYPEVKIIYTRKTDVYVSLMGRATIANKAKADLFISIHSNASKNRNARGCETFTLGAGSSAEAKAAAKYENEVILQEENYEEVYDGFDPRSSESYIIFELLRSHDMEKSVSCAEQIQRNMAKRSKLSDRGVSSAGFLVLHQTAMPSILVELGFLSNPTEEKYLASKDGQKQLAKGIFEGFETYYTNTKKMRLGDSNSKPTVVECAEERELAQDSPQNSDAPVFKVQFLVSSKKLKQNDARLKGVKADYYKDGNMYKYTYGASTDYNSIVKKRKEISKKFSEAFIVAFKNGKRIDTNKAIEEFKKNNK